MKCWEPCGVTGAQGTVGEGGTGLPWGELSARCSNRVGRQCWLVAGCDLYIVYGSSGILPAGTILMASVCTDMTGNGGPWCMRMDRVGMHVGVGYRCTMGRRRQDRQDVLQTRPRTGRLVVSRQSPLNMLSHHASAPGQHTIERLLTRPLVDRTLKFKP